MDRFLVPSTDALPVNVQELLGGVIYANKYAAELAAARAWCETWLAEGPGDRQVPLAKTATLRTCHEIKNLAKSATQDAPVLFGGCLGMLNLQWNTFGGHFGIIINITCAGCTP